MARYSKITKISDVIDKHFEQSMHHGSLTDAVSAVLADINNAEVLHHIVHIDINDDTICITVNDQSVRQMLQLQSETIVQCILRQTNLSNITKVKILFDTRPNIW